jgi:hypothetical protein
MATVADLVAAVDAFMATQKRIIGHDTPPQWGPGYVPAERDTRYPIEIGGELRGAQLMIVGFPHERLLKFRIGIVFGAMICRLDYTDETHQNTLDGVMGGAVPSEVAGPHYHSWPLNRRFFRGMTKPPKLHDAEPYAHPGRSFDAILRWFCRDTNIDQLPPNHRITLPQAETLF